MNRDRFGRISKSLKKTPALEVRSLKNFKMKKRRVIGGQNLAKTSGSFNSSVGKLVQPKLFKGASAKGRGVGRKAPSKARQKGLKASKKRASQGRKKASRKKKRASRKKASKKKKRKKKKRRKKKRKKADQ